MLSSSCMLSSVMEPRVCPQDRQCIGGRDKDKEREGAVSFGFCNSRLDQRN